MNVLAIDTASPEPGVAFLRDGRAYEARVSGDRRCSEELLPSIERVLAEAGASFADVERIAVCAGPGSFTGLRIGLATAWGLGRALGVPVEGVETLEVLADAAREPGRSRVVAALDAGRGEAVVREFSLDGPRAMPVGESRRVPCAEIEAGPFGAPIAAAPPIPLARALAEAVARQPRAATETPAASYSRPSAAEEKHGAA
jgi:tRNA threonylcarbamoyladenosine biosynthesis protein TsaB